MVQWLIVQQGKNSKKKFNFYISLTLCYYRVEGTAAGGQIVISGEVHDSISSALEKGDISDVEIKDMGQHRLKGLQSDTQLYQILPNVLTARKFPEYGAKAEEEVTEEKQSLEVEMEQLAKENEELKEKMNTLEAEAQEAVKKAEELKKWLEDLQKDLPPSLGKELLSATKNINRLMKGQLIIQAAIDKARSSSEQTSQELQETKENLENANTKIKELIDLNDKHLVQIEEYEKALNSKKKTGIINRIRHGISTKKEAPNERSLRSKSEADPEDQPSNEQQPKKQKRFLFRSSSQVAGNTGLYFALFYFNLIY